MPKRIRYVDKTKHHLEQITHLATDEKRYTKRGLILRMEEKGKRYYTNEDGKVAYLEVVTPTHGEKYLKTKPDDTKDDNLLSLPPCPAGLRNKD